MSALSIVETTIRDALGDRPWRLHWDGKGYEYTFLLTDWKDGLKWAVPKRAESIGDLLFDLMKDIAEETKEEPERA